MSIQEHLNKIRNAIYGREVRESIAKGIETAYDDASEKHDNANMEVKIARGTHPNLRSRLEEVDNKQQQTTAQLAQKADDYVVRKRTEPIRLNDMDESVLNAIAGGENTNFTIEGVPRDFSVGPDKTSFARTGTNKFDGIYKKYSLRTDGTVGESDVARSAVVRITGGKTYYFRTDAGDRRR